jgi:hypothetical protein
MKRSELSYSFRNVVHIILHAVNNEVTGEWRKLHNEEIHIL